GLSRATVVQGYEQLIDEGYLQTKVGSGTTVSRQLPDDLLQTASVKPRRHAVEHVRVPFEVSRYGTKVKGWTRERPTCHPVIDFKYGTPALDRFPLHVWRRVLLRNARSGGT